MVEQGTGCLIIMFPEDVPCEIVKKKRQLVIGVTGISTSGKSIIADYLKEELGLRVIPLDEFFAMMRLPRAEFKGETIGDWDRPESIDWNDVARKFNETEDPVVVVEGFILFPDQKMPKIIDALIDIEFSEDEFEVALTRRITRGFQCEVPSDWQENPMKDKVSFTCAYFKDFVWKRALEHPEYRLPPNWNKPLLRLSATQDIEENKRRAKEFVTEFVSNKTSKKCILL